ncbi:MAG TPA: alpha/beta hydrolase [Kribbellaceae bacterium]|nr:alpha/beta hydrolase [Kribbellaceae bacterium]
MATSWSPRRASSATPPHPSTARTWSARPSSSPPSPGNTRRVGPLPREAGRWGSGGNCSHGSSPSTPPRAAGHEVYAPTLTGLGDRSHLRTASTGLTTHIDDVASLIWFEDPRDVILVGRSYGAAIAEAAVADAERLSDREGRCGRDA